MTRLRIIFRKGEEARFLSHLDLTATIEYAVRRARLPIALSEGFNPRPRISLAAALPLGFVGEREIMEIVLREPLSPDDLVERLQRALPPGIRILEAQELPPGSGRAGARLAGAVYRIEISAAVPNLPARIAQLLSAEHIEIAEDREGRTRRRDIRPLLVTIDIPDESTLRLTVKLHGEGSVRPDQILSLLGIPADGTLITRERIDLAD